MAKPYQSAWMSGANALAHVMVAANCDKPTAFKQLQLACGDRAVDGRGCGREHQFNVDRGFDRGDETWRRRLSTANPSDECLNTFEFDRASVLSTWPLDGIPGGASDPPTPKRRRTPGLDYSTDDAPLVIEMRRLIETGKARSPENAARAVVDGAKGFGVAESKVKRLVRGYRKAHPAQPVE